MTLQDYIQKGGQKAVLQLQQQKSMEAAGKFLQQEGVTMTSEEEKQLAQHFMQKKNVTSLTDDQLGEISAGGFYYPIHNCPRGHTKRVQWVFGSSGNTIVDDNCHGCEFSDNVWSTTGQVTICKNVEERSVWE